MQNLATQSVLLRACSGPFSATQKNATTMSDATTGINQAYFKYVALYLHNISRINAIPSMDSAGQSGTSKAFSVSP